MATNNVRDLAPSHGVYNFLLDAQGRIQADFYVFQRGDSLWVDAEIHLRDKLLQIFDRYIIADDVEIADVSGKLAVFGITGPDARPVLGGAGIVGPELAPLQFAEVEWRKRTLTILRSGEELPDSWQVRIAAEFGAELWGALVGAGARPAGTHALNLFRISCGIPQFGVDIRDRDLPQETGQKRALNFTKGCYLGQEIVERIRSRGAVHRQFTAFCVDGALPAAGVKIRADQKEVGEVTSSAILPLPGGDRSVALGYLRREAAGKVLQADTATLLPVSVPFA
jgi:folate-binding protein YgfZ